MDYVWKVLGMAAATIATEPDVVIRVEWQLTGTSDDGYSGTFLGITPLTVDNIDPSTFVPFDQLTQALVLSWVEPVVMNNEVFWQHINEKIDLQIEAKRHNVQDNIPLPWNPTPTPTPPAP